MWFMGGKAVDALCVEKFAATLDAAEAGGGGNSGELGPEWNLEAAAPQARSDARWATLVLFDQVSRNARRGTAGAFAFDARAAELAVKMSSHGGEIEGDGVGGPMLNVLATALMHSESLENHELLHSKLCGDWAARFPEACEAMLPHAESHMAVIRRFGRFPHRNAALSRESTAAEVAWLASDEVPGWARSQSRLGQAKNEA